MYSDNTMKMLFFAMFLLVSSLTQISATETSDTHADGNMQTRPDKVVTGDDLDWLVNDDSSDNYSDDYDDDDDDDDEEGDVGNYSDYYSDDGDAYSGSGASMDSISDDNDRVKPVLLMHLGRLPQPSGHRPPKVAPNVNDSVPVPRPLPAEHRSSSNVQTIILTCVISSCILLLLLVILALLLIFHYKRVSFSRQKAAPPIYRGGYMRALNSEHV